MKYIIISLILLFILPVTVSAHPGRTAADGCHYCRTNCASWGEVAGARHCHGGPPVIPITIAPTFVPLPTATPTSVPTATPIPTVKPTSTPEVKGESTSSTEPTAQEESETNEVDPIAALMGVGALGAGGYWLLRKMQNRGRKESSEPPQES